MKRTATAEEKKEYLKQYRNSVICDMNCFECKFSDCKCSKPPTKAERQMLADAFGLTDPVRKKRIELEQKRDRRIKAQLRYQEEKKLKKVNKKLKEVKHGNH